MHERNQLKPHVIAETQGAVAPFFSPDGEWIGFFRTTNPTGPAYTARELIKISLRGGSPQLLSNDAAGPNGGYWTSNDTIFYTGADSVLHRIKAKGGPSKPLAMKVEGGDYVSFPDILPGDKSALITVSSTLDAGEGRIVLLNLTSGMSKPLIRGAYHARYVPTGHIVFMRAGSLWAVPFDLKTLTITGNEVPIVSDVLSSSASGEATYAFSRNGQLLYMIGSDVKFTSMVTSLVWVDREGHETLIPNTRPHTHFNPRLSPDGKRLAITVQDNNNQDIWIYNLTRGTRSRISFDPLWDMRPLWTPDGKYVVYWSFRDKGVLMRRAANGTGSEEQLLSYPGGQMLPEAFTPDGKQLILRKQVGSDFNLVQITFGDKITEQPLLDEKYTEAFSALSPDGRWLAYTSNEAGRFEVYVRPYPNVGKGKWQVSTEGGEEPLWGPDGKELFYRNGNAVEDVKVEKDNPISFGEPVVLFTGYYWNADGSRPNYDIDPDGQRFLMLKPANQAANFAKPELTSLVVIDNWFEELEHLAPPGQ